MKNKIHRYNAILKYLIDGEKFKLSFFISLVLIIYGTFALGQGTKSVIGNIITSFQFPIFNIFLFSIILYNTVSVCSIFAKQFDSYLIRQETKKKALIEIIVFSIIYNSIYFLVTYILFISFSLIFTSEVFSDFKYLNYKIDINIYTVYYLLRYYLIMILISILNTILYQKFENKIIFLNSILIVGMVAYPLGDSMKKVYDVVIWNYFMMTNYSSFLTEFISSILFLILLLFLSLILFKKMSYVRRK